MLPNAFMLIAAERQADYHRRTPIERIKRAYLDKERQPRILRHWTNR